MENAVLALQVVELGVGPITTTSSFVHNQPRLAVCAYFLDSSLLLARVILDICTLINPNNDAAMLVSQRTNRIKLSSTLIRP